MSALLIALLWGGIGLENWRFVDADWKTILDPAEPLAKHRLAKAEFERGDYRDAIESWKRAYEERNESCFLFNIAQAYRLKRDERDAEMAVRFYKHFIGRVPGHFTRSYVEATLAELYRILELERHHHQPAAMN